MRMVRPIWILCQRACTPCGNLRNIQVHKLHYFVSIMCPEPTWKWTGWGKSNNMFDRYTPCNWLVCQIWHRYLRFVIANISIFVPPPMARLAHPRGLFSRCVLINVMQRTARMRLICQGSVDSRPCGRNPRIPRSRYPFLRRRLIR